jgi:TonB family protein
MRKEVVAFARRRWWNEAGPGEEAMKAVRWVGLPMGLLLVACGLGVSAQDKGAATATQPAAKPAAPEPDRVSVQILSKLWPADRDGFRSYLPVVRKQTKDQWMKLMPAEANPPGSAAGTVQIDCWLHTNGRVTNVVLAQTSGNKALDRAAVASISGRSDQAIPYDSFPYGLSVDRVKVRFTFIYNDGSDGSNVAGGKSRLSTAAPVVRH